MSEEVEKLELRLTRSALERLLNNDKALEMVLTHAAVAEVLGRFQGALQKATQKAAKEAFGTLKDGRLHLSTTAGQAVMDYIAPMVREAIRAHLRENNAEIRELIQSTVAEELPDRVRSGVRNAMATAERAITMAFQEAWKRAPTTESGSEA